MPTPFLIFVLILLTATLAAMRFGILRRRNAAAPNEPVLRKRSSILNSAEREFLWVLQRVVGAHARVCLKVRLSDLVLVDAVGDDWKVHERRLRMECADFVLCSPSTLAPVLVITLDERSARQSRRHPASRRDMLLLEVSRVAGLPVLRMNTRDSYDPADIGLRIRLALSGTPQTADDEDSLVFEDETDSGDWADPLRRTLRNAVRRATAPLI